ncbi:septal ring lytic transglycosylase RlpA family protein [Paraglaciecola sp. MB-3u-78]|uniref:septal ring lytic transglycosylase RlpA family protein n=1 Tax=Paraglaciecola sp. MB-3u-78 TaxID=2058332 RepID=UPI000C3425EB|nr:septal ring lytic transglycosylase RlpA family protein [Paraglaciecola sp. MB-3u-78]PKG99054.1 septal ring lytic transglycosylase RlpA [Paraglaciecola sp. MB-3u-78]
MKNYCRCLGLIFLVFLVVSCAPKGRYYQHQDSAPKIIPQSVTTTDAVAKYVSYAPANMRPYTIRGIRYQPLKTGKGFSDKGHASWYGQKFHGHLTANGEIYDMYKMSAAHKTLPLPSFVRVTNLKNGKQVVVRVNDRGPFHIGRVIDLSYAAALKLDVLKTGITDVKLDVIHVDPAGKITVGRFPTISNTSNKDLNMTNQQVYIQVAALQNKTQIDKLASGLKSLYQHPFKTRFVQGIYKLHLGPIKNDHEADELLHELKSNDYPDAYKVYSD